MREHETLLLGLNAISRAHESNYFTDGHRGAAIIAAVYFCREVDVEDGVARFIHAMIDENWAHTDLCAPFPAETPDPPQIGRIIERMERNTAGLRQAGHNVILPALALKALRQIPQAATPARVDGICKLIDAFTIVEDLELEEGDDIPDWGAPPAVADFVLSELLGAMSRFDGRGQGWSGHLLTYARAHLDLRQLGYTALALQAEHAFKLYIKRIRMGPQAIDKPRPEHPPSALRPHQRAYWEDRKDRPIQLGHVFKYPYGFYGLMDLAEDVDLKRRCVQAAYHVL